MQPDELRQARDLLHMTQAQLAEAIGMHANSVARMERGELPVATRTALLVRSLLRG